MGRLYREWRRRRNQAGELLARVFDAEDMGYGREAWQVYEEWRTGKLSFEEAKNKLERLLAEARAAARA
jgi:hypothetical protein